MVNHTQYKSFTIHKGLWHFLGVKHCVPEGTLAGCFDYSDDLDALICDEEGSSLSGIMWVTWWNRGWAGLLCPLQPTPYSPPSQNWSH